MAGRVSQESVVGQGTHSVVSPSGKHSKTDSKIKHRQLDQRGPSPHFSSLPTITGNTKHNGSTNSYKHYHSPRGSSNQRKRRPQLTTFDTDITGIEKEISFNGDKKKTSPISLNHLLNFTLTPRERSDHHNGSSPSTSHRRNRRYSNYNKEQFLQANCQFIVKEDEDYTVHSSDPDILVNWECIEQLRLFCEDIPSCPICLYPPSAAKMTRCGHIYCSSCVLHYLSLSEKKWGKCPICFESIYKKDLKSVTTTVWTKSYSEGDMITMRLMMRQYGSTIALPRSGWTDDNISTTLFPLNGDEVCKFAKLLSVTPSQIKSEILDKERTILTQQLSSLSNEDESERVFIETALQDVLERETKLNDQPLLGGVSGDSETTPTLELSASSSNGCGQTIFHFNEEAEMKKATENNDLSPPSTNHSPSSAPLSVTSEEEEEESFGSISRWNTSDYVYFYQCADGQHLFLHSINTKCLLKEYGGWENCPDTITARVVEVEHYTMTEYERPHYKYLSHLPITSSFSLYELELKSPLVSSYTLEFFNDKLQKRKVARQKKKREERRREKRSDRDLSGYLKVDLPSNPAHYSPEDFHNFLSVASSPPLPSLLKPRPQTTPPPSGTPSFAQALASSSERKTNKMSSRSFSSSNDRGGVIKQEVIDSDGENYEIVPSFQNAFSDALLTVASESINDKSVKRNTRGKPGGSKTAKKGCKKLVLFSTGGQRNTQH